MTRGINMIALTLVLQDKFVIKNSHFSVITHIIIFAKRQLITVSDKITGTLEMNHLQINYINIYIPKSHHLNGVNFM